MLPVDRTTGLGCIPEGKTVSYQCTVTDSSDPLLGSTIWFGTVFNCTLASEGCAINLLHNRNSNASVIRGGFSARSHGFSGSDFTSSLTFMATSSSNGTTVVCNLGAIIEIGNDTIKIGGIHI